jgi:DNA-directed RNA polymerase specialized sigma24 family protein
MTSTASRRVTAPIAQMTAEWRAIGRTGAAIDALATVAPRDPELRRLVLGTDVEAPTCASPYDLVEYLRQASGRRQREAAAQVIRVLLREADCDPLIARTLVQALLPGLISVATKLQWGRGGDWSNGDEFFSELLSTAWLTIAEWTGQDRPYAVLDLLSAIRCRLRRQLLRAKDLRQRTGPLTHSVMASLDVRPETDLEELSRLLIDLRLEGMREDEVQILYAHEVLGYTIAELAEVTGRDRRALYARRDRGRRRLCA